MPLTGAGLVTAGRLEAVPADRAFRRLRRRRDESEYDDLVCGVPEVTEDLGQARNSVAAVRAAL